MGFESRIVSPCKIACISDAYICMTGPPPQLQQGRLKVKQIGRMNAATDKAGGRFMIEYALKPAGATPLDVEPCHL